MCKSVYVPRPETCNIGLFDDLSAITSVVVLRCLTVYELPGGIATFFMILEEPFPGLAG